MRKVKRGVLTLRTSGVLSLRFLHEALGEEFLQALPAFVGDEVCMRRGITLAVGRFEDDFPSQTRVVLIVLVLEKTNIANALADPELPARIPGERLSFGRRMEFLKNNDLVAALRFQNDTHFLLPSRT